MNKKDISIATITWARNEQEEALLRRALEQLAKMEIPVFISDGGSGAAFLDFLKRFSNFFLSDPGTRGVWPQAKNSLSEAYITGSKFIFYTEPDKLDFFATSLPLMLNNMSVDEQTGVVIASRSTKGFATFPPFQQMTETTINNCCAEITGKTFDYTYGPFLLNRELVPYLGELPQHIGWGWRPFAFCLAHRLGYKVENFADDFYCPPDQQQDNSKERIYRMSQLSQNMEGIVLSGSVNLENKNALNK